MNRTTAFIMALAVGAAALQTTYAQDRDDRGIRIEIKDGRVFVNGEEVEGDSDRITIQREDGKQVTLGFGDGTFWIGDDDDDFPFGHFRNGAFFGDGGFAYRHGDDDKDRIRDIYTLRSRPGTWSSSDLGLFQDRLSDQMVNVERALGSAGSVLAFSSFLDPELRDLERRIAELAREVRRADDDERADLEADLDELLNEAFDYKLDKEREHAEELEERLSDLQKRIDRRNGARAEVIARKKRSLLGHRDDLDW